MDAAGERVEQGDQLEESGKDVPERPTPPNGAQIPPGAGHAGSTLEGQPPSSPVAKDIARSNTFTSSATSSPTMAERSGAPAATGGRSACDHRKERFPSRNEYPRVDGFGKDATVFAGAAPGSDNARGERLAGLPTLLHLIEPSNGLCHGWTPNHIRSLNESTPFLSGKRHHTSQRNYTTHLNHPDQRLARSPHAALVISRGGGSLQTSSGRRFVKGL